MLCLKETHHDELHRKPTINGLRLIAEHHHNKYGSVGFVKNNIDVISAHITCGNNIETIKIDISLQYHQYTILHKSSTKYHATY